jgi:hypothetical protein|tara:strand:- start:835 stop:1101 length:267 start_codon:yes stop_codon:yes gene_type:complete
MELVDVLQYDPQREEDWKEMSEYEDIDEDLEETLKLYEVSVVRTQTFDLEVEAMNEDDAMDLAMDTDLDLGAEMAFEDTYVENIKEIK